MSLLTGPDTSGLGERRRTTGTMGWRMTCGLMALAAVGLVVAVFLGAPLVSILLAGLLLLCPLLIPASVPGPVAGLDSARQARPMTEIVVLSAPDCHLCEDALRALAELGREFPLRVREVGMGTLEGRELVRAHRPTMPPAVLVDGALFSAGRLPRKKLRRLLERAA